MCKKQKTLYKHIFNTAYIANKNKIISETVYVDVLQKISIKGFKTYHIDDFEKLIIHLQSIGLNDSFNISILMHLRDMNYKKMSEIAVIFNYVGDIFAMKKNKMVDRMHNIRRILKQKIDMMRSFMKIEKIASLIVFNDQDLVKNMVDIPMPKHIYINHDDNKSCDLDGLISSSVLVQDIFDDVSTTNNVLKQTKSIVSDISKIASIRKHHMSKHKIQSEWMYYTKSDIINRLHLLANYHFTLEQLQYMNVELKYINVIQKMTHIEIEQYYINVVNKIITSLKEWILICRMYIDIEVNYVECCENMICGNNTSLDLKNFSIDIRNI